MNVATNTNADAHSRSPLTLEAVGTDGSGHLALAVVSEHFSVLLG